jgi:hypothetical protein
MRRVVVCTQTESRYEPPADIVRCAKAISALQRPQSTIGRIVASLVYDSFREPLPAGIRADSHVSRHAVFEAGDFFLDLRLEQETESPLVTLVGQLTNRTDPNKSLAGAPVMVMTRKEVVAHAVYNRFGEFRWITPAPHLRLCVADSPRRACRGVSEPVQRWNRERNGFVDRAQKARKKDP